MYEFISHSENDTIEFASKFASKLNSHSTIVLSGDLGSGKTKFTEGILKYFGLENEISSPTFTIVNEYDANNQKIYHLIYIDYQISMNFTLLVEKNIYKMVFVFLNGVK